MTELDLDAIKRSLAVNRDSQNGWASRVVEDLVAEVDRLRAQRVLDNEEAARLYDFARDKGAALERDATVAYLRAPGTCCSPDVLAENIERGDHRREEKP
jgi:hypothetical protein